MAEEPTTRVLNPTPADLHQLFLEYPMTEGQLKSVILARLLLETEAKTAALEAKLAAVNHADAEAKVPAETPA